MRRPARTAMPVSGGARPDREPNLLSFSDFVDDALFHPQWGYYATGGVRFGTGGHYDTYPLALSPLFGHMIAQYAFRLWRRVGTPERFEICELGAGNGQLCLDVLLWAQERGRHGDEWKAFATALTYRIVERSPALVARQRQQLGPLASTVRWSRADVARAVPRGVPFAAYGLIVANEVLDCLPHHKIVARPAGSPAVAFVRAELHGRGLDRAQLAATMSSPLRRRAVRFREVLQPLHRLPQLAAFARRHYRELFERRSERQWVLACPGLESMFRHAGRLYDHCEALWIDYGEARTSARGAAALRRVFAGPPRSGSSVYDAPGRDDITFMIDFSVARQAARAAGWSVVFYGPQAELARRARVRLDRDALDLIVRHRALNWLLALAGVGPERGWQRHGVTWSRAAAPGHVSVRRYVERSLREFRAEHGTAFKLLITRRGDTATAARGRRMRPAVRHSR